MTDFDTEQPYQSLRQSNSSYLPIDCLEVFGPVPQGQAAHESNLSALSRIMVLRCHPKANRRKAATAAAAQRLQFFTLTRESGAASSSEFSRHSEPDSFSLKKHCPKKRAA